MPHHHAVRAAAILALGLPACTPAAAPSAPPATATAQERLYACQMRGAAAEDRVQGPVGNLSIDSAAIRARVTQDCLAGRPDPVVIGRPGLR